MARNSLKRKPRKLPRIDVRGEKADAYPRGRQSQHRQWWERSNRVVHDDGKLLELEYLPETVMHWSCSQAPFDHPDAVEFLKAVRDSYQPELVICHGDELDLQFLKKAFMNAESPGPVRELEQGKAFVAKVAKLFPRMLLLTSNHIHTRIRYAQSQGNIPRIMMRDWREIIEAPAEWEWRDYVIAREWLWEHGHDIGMGGRGTIAEETVKRFGRPLSVIRGHVHSQLGDHIKPIWITPTRQLRMFYVGCLMDKNAVGYTRSPTVNGCAVTYRGVPHPIPMPKNKHDRWTGSLPTW